MEALQVTISRRASPFTSPLAIPDAPPALFPSGYVLIVGALPETTRGATTKDSKATPPTVPKTEFDERIEFYQTFWSVQNPFSNPSYFQNPDAMATFRANVSKILPVLSEATRKDRLSSTSKSATPAAIAGAKRKRDAEIETNAAEAPANGSALAQPESSKKDYFFAKFLTNFDLLELEVCTIVPALPMWQINVPNTV